MTAMSEFLEIPAKCQGCPRLQEYSDVCALLMMVDAGVEVTIPPETDEYAHERLDKDYATWLIQSTTDVMTEACDGFDPSSGDCASPVRT